MDGSFSTRLDLNAYDDRRRGVLEAIVAIGVLNEADARHVDAILTQSREPLDQIISKLGLAAEEEIARRYAQIFAFPIFETSSFCWNSNERNEFQKKLNRLFLFYRRILPVQQHGDQITVAIVDPSDQEALAGISFALRRPVDPVIITASQFDRLYTEAFPEAKESALDVITADTTSDINRLKDIASAEPVVRYVNRLIEEASRRRASDIHIEPMSRSAHIRLRIDGRLVDYENVAPSQALSIVSRLKILSDLDIAEQRRPQDGRMSFSVGGRNIDLRLSTNPTVNGESLVIRLLDQTRAPLELEALGFSDETCRQLKDWIGAPNGIILLTGPTGSGKTTTLYSLLRLLATGERKILTIEDPVEYKLAGVNQSQVNPAIGLTFASALRSFLRHDPDVIMVGEMRDAETARIAMRAAMTGHLVLSTLHTNDAPSAITRLIDMGVEDYLVASTLLGVVGQRLVRRICSECDNKLQKPLNGAAFCTRCRGSGFHGRMVISELLRMDGSVRAAIKTNARRKDIAQAAQAQSFVSMLDDGRAKISQGLTTLDEVNRAVGAYVD